VTEEHYSVEAYRMRDEAAWMVREDRSGRVVRMSLSEPAARWLVATLNVAILAADVTDYGEGKRASRRSRSAIRKPLS